MSVFQRYNYVNVQNSFRFEIYISMRYVTTLSKLENMNDLVYLP